MDTFVHRLEYSGMDRLVKDADLVLVAFSGGADSSLLLYFLNEYLKGSNTRIAAAHLNHMIRGDEAFRDEEFASKFAASLGVPIYVKRVDIPALAANGGSIEQTARRERYAFFDELSESLGGRVVIATAHNADDNLETVLFNLVRGSGSRGLCGIPPVREDRFIRPLITYSGDEIRELCAKFSISYVVDSTNLCTDYTRNKLRHLVVPHLKEINPLAVGAALRMSEALREDNLFIEDTAKEFLEAHNKVTVPRRELVSLHNAVLTRVLCSMYASFNDAEGESLENVHIREIIRHIREKCGDFRLTVPGGNVFVCENGTCTFLAKDAENNNDPCDNTCEVLEYDSPLYKNGYVLLLSRQDHSKYFPYDENIYNLSIHTAVKFGKIKSKLEVRTRAVGDTIRYGNMNRKLKKLFSEKKIPLKERERIPVVCDSQGILWIPSFPLRDGMAPDKGDEKVYLFCFKEEDFNGLGKYISTDTSVKS